ncbi:MAG: superoxide dismutase [Patescibacteria group bacterium]
MFTLLKLPYAYDALEPYFDKQTMELHHSKHHATYVTKLNEALANAPELYTKSIEELLVNLNVVPENIRTVVTNHGGGHYNHLFFWSIIQPPIGNGGEPEGELASAVDRDFGDVTKFRDDFTKAAVSIFGSGWAWLVANRDNKLSIITTANQDSPITQGLKPLLTIDVWEHAYYLKYQNKRADYIDAWWKIVNWQEVSRKFAKK